MALTRRQFSFGLPALALLAACRGVPLVPDKPVSTEVDGSKVKLFFNFQPQNSVRDARKLGRVLKAVNPHVVCIENPGSDEKSAIALEDKLRQPEMEQIDEYTMGLHRLLRTYQGVKPFMLERESKVDDSNENNPIWDIMMGEFHATESAQNLFHTGDSVGAVDEFNKALTLRKVFSTMREAAMRRAIKDIRRNLISRYPELEREKELRVVINVDPARTALYVEAEKRFGGVQRKLVKPYYFGPFEEAQRMAAFRVNKKLSRSEVARRLMAHMLTQHVATMGVSKSNSAAFGRAVTRDFNLPQSSEFDLERFTRLSRKTAELKRAKSLQGNDALLNALGEEHISIPVNARGVHYDLRRRKVRLSLG